MNTQTIHYYITVDLNYCCEWAFFKRNRQTAMIAIRLGVSDRAVRYHKEQFKCGGIACEGRGNCMKDKLEKLK